MPTSGSISAKVVWQCGRVFSLLLLGVVLIVQSRHERVFPQVYLVHPGPLLGVPVDVLQMCGIVVRIVRKAPERPTHHRDDSEDADKEHLFGHLATAESVVKAIPDTADEVSYPHSLPTLLPACCRASAHSASARVESRPSARRAPLQVERCWENRASRHPAS